MRILLRQLALLLSEEALVFTDAIVEEIKTEIKNKKFFEKEKECVCTIAHKPYAILAQSRELKKLGGFIRYFEDKGEIKWTEWVFPEGAEVYKLATAKRGKIFVDYHLLCFEDGREFFLKQGLKRLSIMKKLPDDIIRQLVNEFCEEIQFRLRDQIQKKKH
ncbi:MAG: hypothetical protein UU87_C0003G0083 [Parcubacteria group bacterium GW2011_GWA2_42_11]|nr:MAG: hypothetical protein UU87_C0003G0083 [Parcubacteria group bacterium GW2011_GWA2_42_11]